MMKIYLAGPEVFLPNAHDVMNHNKALCYEYGFQGLSPIDNQMPKNIEPLAMAREIFKQNCHLISQCDIVLANCNPFRLAIVDDGTSFEIGYAYAQGKRIYGHIKQKMPLPQIVQSRIATGMHSSGYLIDKDGYLLNEDFGNSINLMLEFSILASGGSLTAGNFENCLRTIQQDFSS